MPEADRAEAREALPARLFAVDQWPLSARPATTIVAQAVVLLAAAGASVGFALGTLIVKGNLDAFFTNNAIGAKARQSILASQLAVLALVVAIAASIAWRGRHHAGFAAGLLRVARRLAPLATAGFLPLLFRWEIWVGRDLVFLILTALASFTLQAGLLLAQTAEPFAWERWLGRRVRSVYVLIAPSVLGRNLPWFLVGAGALGYAAYFGYFTSAFHWCARSGWDLAIENNILWNLIHGGPFMKSSPVFGPVGTHFGYHATLFAYAIAPVYALAQRPETLLVFQAALIGAAAIPLYLFARLHLSAALSCLVALLYLFYPLVHGANLYEFHYQPLGTVFLWTALYALETRRDILAIVAGGLALSVREDVSFGLGIFGLYLILSGRRPRAGLVATMVSGAYFVLMKLIVMPRFAAGAETFTYMFQGMIPEGEKGFGGVMKTAIANPVFTLRTLLETGKLTYVLQILVPLAFLPLRSPLALLFLLPGFLFTLLSTGHGPSISIHYQYTAHWTTYLFIALVLALARLDRPKRFAAVGALFLGLVACSYQYGAVLQRQTSWGGPVKYKFGVDDEGRRRRHGLDVVLRLLPANAKVSASAFTITQVSSRTDDYALTLGLYDADYVLFPTEASELIVDEQQKITDLLTTGKFGVVAMEPPFALAKRGHPTDQNRALLSRWR
jgi:uncharacterized membrane protein